MGKWRDIRERVRSAAATDGDWPFLGRYANAVAGSEDKSGTAVARAMFRAIEMIYSPCADEEHRRAVVEIFDDLADVFTTHLEAASREACLRDIFRQLGVRKDDD